MEVSYFIKGFITGAIIGAPLGPAGMLCMANLLKKGRLYGLFSGLGASTADAIFALIIQLGLTYISSLLLGYDIWLRILGGGFVCYIGYTVIVSKPAAQEETLRKNNVIGAFLSTFFLAFTNPMTFITFLALFAGFGIGSTNSDLFLVFLLISGVFVGSLLWWVLLTSKMDFLKSRLNFSFTGSVHARRIAGIVIIIGGILVILGNIIIKL